MFDKLRKEIRTKSFWIIAIIAALIAITNFYGQQNEELSYLQIPQILFGIFLIATLPAIAALALSLDFATLLVKFHNKYHKLRARILKINNQTMYSISDKFSIDTSGRRFAVFNTWYSIGTTLLILHNAGIDKLNQINIILITIGFIFLSLIFISGLNVSVYLIKKRGIMFENNEDGSRINLGNYFASKINSMISPTQIIAIIYTAINEPNVMAFFSTLIMSIIICFSSSLVSFYVLKKRHMNKMMIKLSRKLAKFLPFV